MIVNKELPNKNLLIRNEITKLLTKNMFNSSKPKTSTGIFATKKTVDDAYFDDAKEETKLYQKVYDDYKEPTDAKEEAWNQVPADIYYYEQLSGKAQYNKQQSLTDDELKNLNTDYKEDFLQLYKIYLKGYKNYYELSEREQRIKSEEIKQQVKEFLLRNNEKYRILNERGLI